MPKNAMNSGSSRPRPEALVTTQPDPETKHDSRGAKGTQNRDTELLSS
jgi:hypothetical protein